MLRLMILLLLIFLFLAGTFSYSYRLLKKLSKREESIDPAKIIEWKDED